MAQYNSYALKIELLQSCIKPSILIRLQKNLYIAQQIWNVTIICD